MRKILASTSFAALLTLSACSTPIQTCISNASADRDEIAEKFEIAQGNVERGYAIHRQSVPYTYTGQCFNGTVGSYSCQKTGTRVLETPVTIDVNEERQKLAALERQLILANQRADAQVAQCRALYPQT
ncbi:MAG: hypothetical protein L3J13_04115 [Devosiaceae bacterium]|nr:hypothetical protein [Devosiaceae bacterium]